MKLLMEGKAKKIFFYKEKSMLVQYFKDDTTAYNNKKNKKFTNKGIINNYISANIFEYLNKKKIKTHYIKRLNERQQLIKKLKIIPLEVVVRNRVAGSLQKKLGLEFGKKISPPILEFYLKSDKLNDPLLNEQHIIFLKLCSEIDLKKVKKIAIKINFLLIKYFNDIRINLIDFKLEFGKYKNQILLADEISPDSCRLWDKNSKKSLDKDLFRENKGDLLEAYTDVLKRIKKKCYDI